MGLTFTFVKETPAESGDMKITVTPVNPADLTDHEINGWHNAIGVRSSQFMRIKRKRSFLLVSPDSRSVAPATECRREAPASISWVEVSRV